MDDLRMKLLAWVQQHLIRNYDDNHVLSHNEGLEQLVAIVEGRKVPRFYDAVAGELHPWVQGPCDSFAPDGRSNICEHCDWPEDEHDTT